jgi:phosphoribosylanthranilate isomerase
MPRTKAKICGISTEAALEAAIAGGASHIGLVFFEKSPRNVDLETARRLAEQARGRVRIVALIVDADDARISEIIDAIHPDMLQLHGKETAERVAEIAALSRLPIIKAVSVACPGDVTRAADYSDVAHLILFDAKPPSRGALPGGNGVAFDWSLMTPVKGRMSYMLSGGLTPENVGDAILETGASLVDVSSGVETAPGEKDPVLIRRFLDAVKTANQA